jgi:hypothetical protein
MAAQPPGLHYHVESSEFSAWSASGGGYQTATATTSPGVWVPVGVSARQESSGKNRLLSDMFPLTGTEVGAKASSKDHIQPDSGRVQAGVRLLRGVPNL